MKHFCWILLFILSISQCRYREENTITQFPGKPLVPAVIQNEHDSLLTKIHKITLFQDSTGHKARKLYDLIQHHFKEEEDYVLPPLGLLPLLAGGQLPEKSKEFILLTDKLRSQLPHMYAEHQLIKAYLDELLQSATNENRLDLIEFENELQKHAKAEEELFFPAAILVGEYLKLKSN